MRREPTETLKILNERIIFKSCLNQGKGKRGGSGLTGFLKRPLPHARNFKLSVLNTVQHFNLSSRGKIRTKNFQSVCPEMPEVSICLFVRRKFQSVYCKISSGYSSPSGKQFVHHEFQSVYHEHPEFQSVYPSNHKFQSVYCVRRKFHSIY